MNVVMVKTKKTVDAPDSYALRLIEQGKAVPAANTQCEDVNIEAAQSKKKRKGDA